MKTTLFFVAFLLYATFSFSQINTTTPWIWMKGDNTIDQPGVYGTQGVPATTNKPGARNASTTWKDNAGSLWLFGGSGNGASTVGYLSDLWKYDPLFNKWTWIKGDQTTGQYSIYGTQGISNINNKPGGNYAGVSWTGKDGSLWLFGGFGYTNNNFGFLNTLWNYNSTTNEWTWVKGDNTIDQPGVYGIKGVSNSNNKPGARYGSQTWVDANGNLWLYGGYGFDNNTAGILNDIWKYNTTTNEWIWINGDSIVEQVAVYGTKGVADAANKPGARYVGSSWKDADDNLWLFGGYGYDEANVGNLNDMWKYNSSTNQWTWMAGDRLIDQPGSYGIQGTSLSTNKPGARYVSSAWTDPNGELWLFGGYGLDASNPGYLNDFWKYNTVTNRWTWIKGDSTVDHVGVYGIQGIADPASKSGARTGSLSWTDAIGNLWLFGGYGFDGSTSGVLNDLWKVNNYQVVLPIKLLSFNGVLNNDIVQLQWQSEQEAGFSHFNIQRSFDGTTFVTIGNVNGKGNNDRSNYDYPDHDLNNRSIQKVFYRLQLIDKDGSFTYSKVLVFDLSKKNIDLQAFPNPAVQSLNLSFDQDKTAMVTINITDMNGKLVKKQAEKMTAGRVSISIDVSTLSSGAYIISLINKEAVSQHKFIKQ